MARVRALFRSTLSRHVTIAATSAGYVFCCSGVFIYQYLKYQEVKRGIKGHPAPQSAAVEASGGGSGGGVADGNSISLSRSKAAVLSEMRQIQHELTDLERRGPK